MGYNENKAGSRRVVKAEDVENVNLLAPDVTVFYESQRSKRRASKQYKIETASQKIGVKCRKTFFLVIPVRTQNGREQKALCRCVPYQDAWSKG